jgi:hypothetical protein
MVHTVDTKGKWNETRRRRRLSLLVGADDDEKRGRCK